MMMSSSSGQCLSLLGLDQALNKQPGLVVDEVTKPQNTGAVATDSFILLPFLRVANPTSDQLKVSF